jgi:type IV secretion system protein TrbL
MLLIVAAVPEARAQAGTGIMDQVAGDYRAVQFVWLDRLIPIAQRVFLLLAGIEVAVSAAIWGLRRPSTDDVLGEFILKFAFVFVLIFSFEFWIPPIIGGFVAAGQRASGTGAFSPSEIVDLGIDLWMDVVGAPTASSLLNPVNAIAMGIVGLAILASFVSIAAQFVKTLVESFLVLSAGVVFLGFAAFRATASFAENYLVYAFHVGVKLFMINLLVGVGFQLAGTWRGYAASMDIFNMRPAIEVLAGALLFALLVLTLPGSFARGITGGARLGLAEAIRGK